MFKLMHKKLNKKGFTLAELLVVVAIVAILVAIAIPIFTESLKEAQIRTNEANMRSTKAAAVSHILANWNKYDSTDTNDRKYYREGAKKDGATAPGWYAVGEVNAAGNLVNVTVRVDDPSNSKTKNSASDTGSGGIVDATGTDEGALPTLSTDTIKAVEDSYNMSPRYYTVVKISDTDINKKL